MWVYYIDLTIGMNFIIFNNPGNRVEKVDNHVYKLPHYKRHSS